MSFSAGKNLENNINTTEAQTLSNKTLDNTNAIDGASIDNSTITGASIESPSRLDMKKDTLANLQTYAASATNGQLVYATDAKKTFQVVDAALVEVGSGDGSVNYIENSDFEQGIDGYTDDVNFTIAQTELAAEVLRGTASAKLSKAAVDASNEEISVPFTVSRADLAKKLTISFEYDASDANYADNDILIGVRQDPNGTPSVIRINGEDLKGGKGTHYAQFQTDASIDEYELFFKVNSTNASAYDIIIDDVKVGPREVAFGTILDDYEEFTPIFNANTGTPTVGNGSLSGFRRRNGDSMEYMIQLTLGSTSSIAGTSNWYFQDPDYTFDESKRPRTNQAVGSAFALDQGTAFYAGTVHWGLVSTNAVYIVSGADGGYWGAANPFAWSASNADYLTIKFEVPIQGWSSNAATSEDLGGREVVVQGAGNGGGTFTANVTNLDFTPTRDTTASFDGTTFTAPETGDYSISGMVDYTTNNSQIIYAWVNGVQSIALGRNASTISDTPFNGQLRLEKGDILNIRANGSATLNNTTTNHWIHIQKLASPQTILETETVAARYTSNSGQSVNSTQSIYIYENLEFDTHNAYNTSTGEYTAPIGGYYQVSASWSSATANESMSVVITVNGVDKADQRHRTSSALTFKTIGVSSMVKLEKGDVLEIQANSNTTVSSATSATDRIYLSIARFK